MMVMSSWKKVFFGICVIMLIITMSLYSKNFFINEDESFIHLMEQIKNSSIFEKIVVEKHLHPECQLPLEWTLEKNFLNSSQPIPVLHMKEDDICLELLIKKHCYNDKLVVPNVVHYINFNKKPIKLYSFLSYLATWKHIKPCFIVMHGDKPLGPFFHKFQTFKPRVIYIKRTPKQTIFGKKISYIQHKADVARLEIIIKYGGIYLDQDQIVLRSFDPLRNHSIVLGQETDSQIGNAVIIAEPSAIFLKFWLGTYRIYNPNEWAAHSTVIPHKLTKYLSKMVFIVPTFFKPNYLNTDDLYKRNIDWSNFYAIHLYRKTRLHRDTLETIRYADSTYGSVARYIYYGEKTLQKKVNPKKTVKKTK